MQENQISHLHYLLQSNLTHQFPSALTTPTHTLTFPNPLYQVLECNSTTSDEAEESIINERKQRRMISNRESARRSRMRKQRQLDELWSQVVCLRHENQQLIEKLNQTSESCDQLLQENAQLKEETSELRQMLADHMHLTTTI